MSSKLFSVFLTFSDHTIGIGQCEAEGAENALKKFVRTNESLEDYDRGLLLRSIMPLTHLADERGVWLFHFNPDLMGIEWPDDNPVLGGHIVQTDSGASSDGE